MTASSSVITADSIGSSNPFFSSLESITVDWGHPKFEKRETIKIQSRIGILSISLREKPFQRGIEEKEIRKTYVEQELNPELRKSLLNDRKYSGGTAEKKEIKMEVDIEAGSWNDYLNMY